MQDHIRESPRTRTISRRHLTIVFCDLSSFTALTGALEPEHVLRIVDHLKGCATRILSAHGGTIVDFRGDSVMAMFGYPQSTEYDGRRAIEAVMHLHAAIRDAPQLADMVPLPVLRLHSGVHSGVVLLLEHDPIPGQYAVIGEVPNIAARLSDVAREDEILVTTATLGPDTHLFDVRDMGAVSLQGKRQPVPVLQVLGHSDAATRYEAQTKRGLTPFVGRDQELKALTELLQRTIGGPMTEVAVVGSAGVGKSRLLDHFLRLARDLRVRVCRGYCENYLVAEPLQPFLQMLRQLAKDHADEAAPESDPGAGAIGGDSLGAASADLVRAASAIFDARPAAVRGADSAAAAFRDLFAALSRECPLVLFIDDAQWADDATTQVLVMIRELAPPSLLIVTASRESPAAGVRSTSIQVLSLAPFGRQETAEAIRRLRPDVDPLTADEIQQISGGNPLYIEELCHRSLPTGGQLESVRTNDLPAWLGTLIESRVEQLPPRQLDLIRAAAVLGTMVSMDLLEQVGGCQRDDPILRDLVAKDLMFPGEVDGTLRFKHGITRDVIYASIRLDEREALHRRIGELLERRAQEDGLETLVEPLAYHFRAAARPDRAAHYAELAGDKALAVAAADRARHQYASALAALNALEPTDNVYARWSRIVHLFGLACVFDPTRDQLQTFDRAAVVARQRGDQSGLARAEYWRGFIRYALGESGRAIEYYEAARSCCRRAIDEAVASGHRERALEMEALDVQLLAAMGQVRAAAGEHDAALALLDEALEVKRQHRRSSRPAVGSAYALACKGAVLGDVGRFAEAHECLDEALEAIRAGHTAVECSILGWRSAVCLWQGRWEDARALARRAQTLSQRVGSFYVLAMGQSVAAYATWMLERTPTSIDDIARATSWLETCDKRLSISMSYGWLADIAAGLCDGHKSRLYAARAIRRSRVRDPHGEIMSYRALATLPENQSGRQAATYLDRAMAAAVKRRSRREQAVTLLHQGHQAARRDRRHEAQALLERARAEFEAMGMSWHFAVAGDALTQLPALQPEIRDA